MESADLRALAKTPSADRSAEILTERLKLNHPFLFLRYGDGALECIRGDRAATRDDEAYTPELACDLHEAWQILAADRAADRWIFIGDWLTASFAGEPSHVSEWRALLGAWRPWMLHFETLLLMRRTRALYDFYRTVQHSPLRKALLGPPWMKETARKLGAVHIQTELGGLHARAWFYEHALISEKFQLLLFAGGLAVNLPVVHCWQRHPQRTYIHVGSAFDPLTKTTRSQQLAPVDARAYYRGVLCD